jgi:hypothetical protein
MTASCAARELDGEALEVELATALTIGLLHLVGLAKPPAARFKLDSEAIKNSPGGIRTRDLSPPGARRAHLLK